MMWTAILLSAAGCYALKLAGLSVPQRWLEAPRVRRIAGVLPVALLAALVVVQAFTTGHHLVVDSRAVGLTCGGIAVYARAPFPVVIAVAAVSAALAYPLLSHGL